MKDYRVFLILTDGDNSFKFHRKHCRFVFNKAPRKDFSQQRLIFSLVLPAKTINNIFFNHVRCYKLCFNQLEMRILRRSYWKVETFTRFSFHFVLLIYKSAEQWNCNSRIVTQEICDMQKREIWAPMWLLPQRHHLSCLS